MIRQQRRLLQHAMVRVIFGLSSIEFLCVIGKVDMVVAGAGTGKIIVINQKLSLYV